jgi:predicted HicB family RNase H-like nuclease
VHEEVSNETNKGNTGIMKYLEYKGYTGSIEYSPDDNLLYGKVLGIRGLISYEGDTGKALETDFREAINAYLADYKAEG